MCEAWLRLPKRVEIVVSWEENVVVVVDSFFVEPPLHTARSDTVAETTLSAERIDPSTMKKQRQLNRV
jgi:hypothetical protein